MSHFRFTVKNEAKRNYVTFSSEYILKKIKFSKFCPHILQFQNFILHSTIIHLTLHWRVYPIAMNHLHYIPLFSITLNLSKLKPWVLTLTIWPFVFRLRKAVILLASFCFVLFALTLHQHLLNSLGYVWSLQISEHPNRKHIY